MLLSRKAKDSKMLLEKIRATKFEILNSDFGFKTYYFTFKPQFPLELGLLLPFA